MTGRDPARRRSSVAWALAGAGALVFVVVLVQVLTASGPAHADDPVLTWFVGHRTPWATRVLTVVSDVFGAVLLPVLVAAGCLGWWWRSGRWWRPALLAAAMVVQVVCSLVLKAAVARPRPPDLTQTVPGAVITHSFPSGHTMGAATLATALVCLLGVGRGRPRGWWWASGATGVAVTALVALSRLYLGYHFLTDVVAGAAAGFAVGVLVLVPPDRSGPREPAAGGP